MIKRYAEKLIDESLQQGYATILYGARQVGKTTLSKFIGDKFENNLYLNCDDPTTVARLQNQSLAELSTLVNGYDIVIIDEAQRVENIGITIKLIHDALPSIKLLVTGSSSLDLANKIKEPLTGRSREILLFPLSIKEVANNIIEADGYLKRMMIYGGYPGVWNLSDENAGKLAKDIANNYLYRDAFNLSATYDQTIIDGILRLLAHQVGSEVSYNEIATSMEISKNTVMRYVDLLEKAFIVFRVPQFRKNKRVQIGRLRKIYFYDLGMRNALIDDFRPLDIRNDVGALWENLMILERMKLNEKIQNYTRYNYWRSRDSQEVDLIEESGDKISAFEFKWCKDAKIPVGFTKEYPDISVYVVNKNNYWGLI